MDKHTICYAQEGRECLKNARLELEQYSEEELDDLVHDIKSGEAAEINNQGREDQIDFILGDN